MNLTTLTLSIEDRIAVVTFTTPDRLNSITPQRFADLEAALDTLEASDEAGALILTGSEDSFCVGLDLDLLEHAFDDLDYFDTVVRRLAAIIRRIELLPFPTISANNGITRAGGFELSLACDFMIVADEAKVGDVHTDSGVLPACVTLRLTRRIGEQRAKEMLWTARWYDGPEAVAIGLALKSVPRAALLAEAKALASNLVDKPRPALSTLKETFRKGQGLGVEDGAAMELATFSHYMRSEPYGREGYNAFREKRRPDWKIDRNASGSPASEPASAQSRQSIPPKKT